MHDAKTQGIILPVRAYGQVAVISFDLYRFKREIKNQKRTKALPRIPGLLIIAKGKGKMLLRVVLLACLLSRVRKTDCYLLGRNKEESRSKNMLAA
jgi:hypothetical protein